MNIQIAQMSEISKKFTSPFILLDFLRDVAGRESWKLRYRAGTFSELLGLLEQGEIDLLPSVALTFERLQRFDFGRVPVLENWGS